MKCPNFRGSGRKTLFETFLDFCFFLCISPYRISRCDNKHFPNGTGAKIVEWKVQKVLAVLFALIDLFGSVTRIRLQLEKKLDNPVGYFNFLWSISVTLMHVAFYFVLWTKQHHILKAVEIFRKSFSNSINRTALPCSPVIGFTLCILSLVLGILPSLKASHLLPHPSTSHVMNWSPSLVFRAHVTHAQFMFFISNTSPFAQNSTYYIKQREVNMNSLDDLNALEIAQGVGHIIVYTARYMGAYFVDLFMIISAVTMWLGANEFVQESTLGVDNEIPVMQSSEMSHIVSTSPIDVGRSDENVTGTSVGMGESGENFIINSEMVSKYADLKCLANAINGAMSPILFCYVFEAIFYYAINLNSIFTAYDWHARIQVSHFLVGCASVLGFSADVTRKMDGFRLWLVNGNTIRKSIGSDLLVGLIHETQSKTIAVSAFGIFTIDYPLIFNIVTTTVTFFLIVVQFVPSAC